MGSRSYRCKIYAVYALVILGASFVIAGIIVVARDSFKSLVKDKIKENLPLKNGTESFKKWKKPADRFWEYYMFNVTNLAVANGSVPEIKQVGPYTYREVLVNNVTNRTKVSVGNRTAEILSYIPNSLYFYDKSRSCKNCDPTGDKITTINYPLLVISELIYLFKIGLLPTQKQKDMEATKINQMLRNNSIGLFQTRSVDQILWGYEDPNLAKVVNDVLNSNIVDPTLVYALQANNSGTGRAKIFTGEEDVDRVATYFKWKGQEQLSWWNSNLCNMINGTEGERFKPEIDKDDHLYIFAAIICRSVKLIYESKAKVFGIELDRFTPPKEILESGDVNPNNKGFCVSGQDKNCLPSGLLDIKACKGGYKAPPLVASLPHFYLGDPRLQKTFNLTAKKALDATFIDIEPNTGLTMQAHQRLQLNLAMSSYSMIKILLKNQSSEPVFHPVFYSDKSGKISEEDADDFKKKVLLPLLVAGVLQYMMIVLGVLFLLIALIIAVLSRRKREKYNAIS